MRWLFLLFALPCLGQSLPDPVLTPGEATTRTNYIGGTDLSRLPHKLKYAIFTIRYGIAETNWSDYELDFLIPLEVGGEFCSKNMWPVPKADIEKKKEFNRRLIVEAAASESLSFGEKLDLAALHAKATNDWVHAYDPLTYSTTFQTVETPISESGNWYNTMSVSADWSNMVVVTQGRAVGKNGHDTSDSNALLTGSWGQNQDCSGTVYRVATPTANFPELELHVNCTMGSHSFSGYEALFSMRTDQEGNYLVRWNGPPGDFTAPAGPEGTAAVNGDTIRFYRSGNDLFMKINSTQILTATDTTFMAGSPGIGADSNDTNYDYDGNFGLTSYTATDGVSPPATGSAGRVIAQSTLRGVSVR